MKKNINIFLIIITLVLQYSIVVNNNHTIIYNVKNNYLEGNNSLILPANYKIDEEKKIISRVDSRITVNEFINKITTNGTLSIIDNNNNKVNNNIIVKTGNVLRVEYSSDNIINYKLSVIGDVISEGNISLNGAKKIAEHIVDKNVFTENIFLLAADYDGNDSIRINDVTKMVRNIKESSVTLTASFIVQDNNAASVSVSKVSCTTTSDIKKCEIIAPALTAKSGYQAIGWNTDKNATTSTLNAKGKVSISNNVTYYSITRNNTKITATFTISNTLRATASGTSATCYLYNGASSCEITAPTLTAKSGYQVVGWNTNKNATSAQILSGGKKKITANVTYYSIVGNKITVTFNKNKTFDNNTVNPGQTGYDYIKTNIAADSLEYYQKSCASFDSTGCYIDDLPAIYSSGNEPINFLANANNYSTNYKILETKFTKDTTLYARVFNYHIKNNFILGETMKINNVVIEFEKGLSASVYSQYENYFKTIYSQMPVLFSMKGKIRVLSSNTYNKITRCGSKSIGCTYSNYIYSQIELKVNESIPFIAQYAAVHELGHAFDAIYGAYTRNYDNNQLNKKDNFNSLFNKYAAMDTSKRPLSAYAYTNINEFVADAIAAYHSKNYYQNDYKNLLGYNPITDELYKVVDKYICITKNKYNENATACK